MKPPTISKRPKTPVDVRQDETKAFANIEFEMDLSQNQDAVARLGMDAKRASIVYKPLTAAGLYIPKDGGDSGATRLEQLTGKKFDKDTVLTTGEWAASNKVWNHEFRHRGMSILRERFSKEDLTERFGSEVANIVYEKQLEEILVDDVDNSLPDDQLPENLMQENLSDSSKNLSADSRNKVKLVNTVLAQLAFEVLAEDGRPVPITKKENPAAAFERRKTYSKKDKEKARGFLARLLFGE